jgi:hypothetical protein
MGAAAEKINNVHIAVKKKYDADMLINGFNCQWQLCGK